MKVNRIHFQQGLGFNQYLISRGKSNNVNWSSSLLGGPMGLFIPSAVAVSTALIGEAEGLALFSAKYNTRQPEECHCRNVPCI